MYDIRWEWTSSINNCCMVFIAFLLQISSFRWYTGNPQKLLLLRNFVAFLCISMFNDRRAHRPSVHHTLLLLLLLLLLQMSWITVLPSHSCGGTLQNLDIKLLHSSMQTSADHQSRRRHVSHMTDKRGETWSPSGMSKVRSRPQYTSIESKPITVGSFGFYHQVSQRLVFSRPNFVPRSHGTHLPRVSNETDWQNIQI